MAFLVAAGTVLELALLLLYVATGLDRTSYLFEPFFGMAYIVYFAAAVLVSRSRPSGSMASVAAIVAFGCVTSATFLLQNPTLSDDIYRYIWDGKLIVNGISPYAYAPDASQLAFLRDSNWVLVNSKDVVSPYPPLLELLNGAVHLVSPTVLAYKAAFLVPNFAIIAGLPFLLRRLKLDPRLSIIYSWNPLFVLEFSSSGHDDPLALFFVLVSFYALFSGRRTLSAGAMALGVLSKLYPLLFVPILLKKWGVRGAAVFSALVIVFYVPFLLSTGNVLAPISVYVLSNRSAFNGGAFSVFVGIFDALDLTWSFDAARLLELSIFLVALVWLTWKATRRPSDDLRLGVYCAAALTLYISLSSTVQPWYLAWIFVPFLTIMSSWTWIIFSGTIVLTYYTYTQPPIQPGYWAEIVWVKVVEYAQLYGVATYEILSRTYLRPLRRLDEGASKATTASGVAGSHAQLGDLLRSALAARGEGAGAPLPPLGHAMRSRFPSPPRSHEETDADGQRHGKEDWRQ